MTDSTLHIISIYQIGLCSSLLRCSKSSRFHPFPKSCARTSKSELHRPITELSLDNEKVWAPVFALAQRLAQDDVLLTLYKKMSR